MKNESMRILSLRAENVKRLHLVELDFDGGLKIIGGRNEQGKSSTLDSLAWLIGGKKLLGPSPIRDGEESMSSEATLEGPGGKLIITRTMTHKSDSIKIVGEDGRAYPSPQALLDGFKNALTLDPLEFSRLDAKKQGEVFMALLGLDFTEIDKGIKFNFDERTVAKRLLGQIESTLEPMQEAAELVDVSALSKEIGESHKHNSVVRDEAARVRTMKEKRALVDERITALVDERDELTDCIDNMDAPREIKDTDAIQSKINAAGEINARHAHNAKMEEIKSRIEKGRAVVDGHDQAVTDGREEKSKLLAGAKVPIKELGIDDKGLVTYKGFAFSQCSSAEKLRVSFAIAVAMKPKLKLVMIRDGAYLDGDNLKAIAQMADESGMDVLMERVGDGDECSVIIEDGRVLA